MTFVDDPGVRVLGYLDLEILEELDTPFYTRIVDVELRFGGTIITVTAKYRNTNTQASCKD
jgi:hypothetical protein